MAFAAAPREPLQSNGGGFLPGLSVDQHWDKASIQALYVYETPLAGLRWGIHRFGLSLKADLELGFLVDALYILNPDRAEGIEGLSGGAGFDYSFLEGDLYILFEYLYNGYQSASSPGFGGYWVNNHYLYGTALYRFTDFFSLSLGTIFCFDDLSFQPIAALDYEVFQGFSLNLTAQVPLDRKSFGGGETGELGPTPFGGPGARFILNAGARLRF